jgi:hypothetical protein|tara:strand:- start:504 stop:1028 length:525 start_codon:yes stop_codon:yes gene_type:complete
MKRGLVIGVIVIFLFSFNLVFAALPPGPVCNIEGIIESSEFAKGWSHKCLEQGITTCPVGGTLSEPDRYILKIKIIEVSTIEPGYNNEDCNNEIIGKEIGFGISVDNVKEGHFFEKDTRIEAVTQEGYLSSYNLKGKIEPGPEPDKPTDNTYLHILIAIVLVIIISYFIWKKAK